MKEKVVITGSNGFLGSFLCNEISNIKTIKVTGIFRKKEFDKFNKKNLNYLLVKDLNKPNLRFLDAADYIIHCAGRAHIIKDNDKNEHNHSNYKITKNLFKIACKKGVKRFIYISTVGVLGDNTENREPFNEFDIPHPSNNYAKSKFKAELFIKNLSKNSKTEFVIIRPPTIYGKYVKGSFDKLIKLVDLGIPLPFKGFKNKKSFVSVENLSKLVIKSLKNKNLKNKTVLISDIEISLENLINKIAKKLKKRVILFYFPKILIKFIANFFSYGTEYSKLSSTLLVNNSHLKRLLNWNIEVSFDKSLEKIINSYKKL
jgi:nucleoside-diphosphate-sugar epimerase